MLKQMGKLSSKYGRYIFFTFLVIICVTLFLPGTSMECGDRTRGDSVQGTLFGKEVTKVEFEDARERWSACRRVFAHVEKTGDVMRSLLDSPKHRAEMRKRFGQMAEQIGNIIFQQTARQFVQGNPTEEEMTDYVWAMLAFLKTAQTEGITVPDVELADFIQDSFIGEKSTREQYIEGIEKETRISVEQFERTVREALVLERYFTLVRDGASVSAEAVYNEYVQQTERCKVRSVKFVSKDFEALVSHTPTRQAVRPIDERRRPTVIDDDSIFAYYLREKDPLLVAAKYRLEYVFAEYAKFKDGVAAATDTQMEQRYSDEKEKYRIHTRDGVAKPLEEVKDEVKKSLLDTKAKEQYEKDKETKYVLPGEPKKYKPFDSVKAEIEKGLSATDDEVKAAYEKDKTRYFIKDEDKKYKLFEEVKAELKAAIEKDAAAEKAIAKLGEFQGEIDARQITDANATIDFPALAAKHGLACGKTPPFDENHMGPATAILGTSKELENAVKNADQFPVGTILQRMSSDTGSFISRIDEKVPSFVPPLTLPIREKLSTQMVHELARKLCFHAAQELYAEAKKRIDAGENEWTKAHGEVKLEEAEKAKASLRRDIFERLVAERGLSLQESQPLPRGQGDESELFDRPRYEVELLPTSAGHEGEPKDGKYQETYRVAQLIDRYPPDGKDFDTRRLGVREQLSREKKAKYLENMLDTVWEAAKLEDRLHTKPAGGSTPLPDDSD